MPTSKRQHTLTETDELTAALKDAAERWPEHADSHHNLLLELIREGRDAIMARADRIEQERDRDLNDRPGSVYNL